MNGAHLHLLFNHVPILGSLFGLLLLAWGMARRDASVTRVGLAAFVLAALFALAAYFTGEGAIHAVRGAPGVSRTAVEPHEEAAKIASWVVWAMGILAAWLLWRHRREDAVPRRMASLALVLALASAGLMGWTSLLGGVIRHSEIRGDGLDRRVVDPVDAAGVHPDGAGAPERRAARES